MDEYGNPSIFDTGELQYLGSFGSSSPVDFGGTPVAMPTNNWWESSLKTVSDVAKAYVSSGGNRSSPTGYAGNRPINPPPGFFGLFPQAGSAPGGAYDRYGNPVPGQGFGADKMAVVVVVFVVVLVVMLARR